MTRSNTLDWRHYYTEKDEHGEQHGYWRRAGLLLLATAAGIGLYRAGLLKPALQKGLVLSDHYGLNATDDAIRKLRMVRPEQGAGKASQYLESHSYRAFELDKALTETLSVLDQIRSRLSMEAGEKQLLRQNIDEVLGQLLDESRRAIKGRFQVTAEAQSAMLKAVGARYITAEDIARLSANEAMQDPRLRAMSLKLGALRLQGAPLRIDPDLLITDAGQLLTKGSLSALARQAIESLEYDFAIPFAGFNPLRLFRVSNILGLRKGPLTHVFGPEAIQPLLTGESKPLEGAVFIGGKVFDLSKSLATGKLERINPGRLGYLMPMGDPVAREYIRAMAGIPSRIYQPYERGVRGAYAKIARLGGFGFQDAVRWGDPDFRRVPGSGMLPGINDIYSNISWAATQKLKPWSSYEIPDITRRFLQQKWLYVNQIDAENMMSLLTQLGAGRRNLANVTTLTMIPYVGVARMNTMMANFGLALPTEHMGSASTVFANMFLRRAAFIGMGLFAWRYLNYEMENLFGFRPEAAMARAWAGTTVGLSAAGERLGLPEKAQRIGALMPGTDQFAELPGVRGLTFWAGMTPDEVREYWESGEDPIRKGRYWPLGSTPLTGGRITYYRPNRLRRLESKWQYTPTLYGSEDEYFAHAPIPTPRYPAAPIRRYITDKYWQERATYYERPYPVTGGLPELEGIPLFGPLLAHVSDIIKPRLHMHPEVWEGEAATLPKDAASPKGRHRRYLVPPYRAVQYRQVERADTKEDLDPDAGLPLVRKGFGQGNVQTSSFVDQYGRPVTDPRSAKRTIEQFLSNLAEMGGFYGFTAESLRPSERVDWNIRDLATASNMTSWNRLFWDSETGGMGGDVNEVLRRAIGRRRKVERDVNPILNRMPSWLPRDDFYNLHYGDPYTKIRAGEIRLPGAAYESIYHVPAAEYIKNHPLLSALDRLGIINRYEFYDPINRLRILANAFPWSDEYRETSRLVSSLKLSPEQQREVRKIREQARQIKQPLRIYPYRFRYSDLETERVTVREVLNRNTILTDEYPDHPVRLAGIKPGDKAAEWLREHLQPGTSITIGYDPYNKVSADTYKTIRAVVYAGRQNINRMLLEENLAEESEHDFSPAAVHARFGAGERLLGKIWERFAHLNTPFHTKLLQVRSAYEDWRRREVYGKNIQFWERPWSEYVVPTYESLISHHPVVSVGLGAAMGALFGRTPFGRKAGMAIGAGLVGAGAIYRMLYELAQGETWVPSRRRAEWALEEYVDILKYIKYRRLFMAESIKAQTEEDFDVVGYLSQAESFRYDKKERLRELNALKRQLYTNQVSNIPAELKAVGLDMPDDVNEDQMRKAAISAINSAITETQQAAMPEVELPPAAARALEYYRQMRGTMYGYQPNRPMQEFIAALPRKQRRYFGYFLQMPRQEYEKLKEIAPPWLFYGLAPAHKDTPPAKPDLAEYFQRRFLPEESWPGWNPDVSLDDIRVKLAQRVLSDVKDISIFPDDEARAKLTDVAVPRIHTARKPQYDVQERLRNLLSGIGVYGIEMQLEPNEMGTEIDLDLEWDIKNELVRLINRDPAMLLA